MLAARAVIMIVPALAIFGEALWSLWRPSTVPSSARLADSVLCFGFAMLFNLGFPWFSLGYVARTVTLVFYASAGLARAFLAVRGSRGAKGLISHTTSGWTKITGGLVMLVLIPVIATRYPKDVVVRPIQTPVAQGVWYVAQGGGSTFVNHHYPISEQRYSLDLVRLDQAGRSYTGSPSSLESYVAWGSQVLAPASGLVVGAVDGLPDMEIGARDQENLAGNHVVIETDGGVRILLCHLRRGSVAITEGSRVNAGEIIGEIGNSGNTTQPHLHLQAMRLSEGTTWVGVPLEIAGAILHRGDLLRAGQ